VAAQTPLLPRLAQRQVLLRYPYHSDYLDRTGKPQAVEWIALLPRYQKPFLQAFDYERDGYAVLKARTLQLLDQGSYGIAHCADGALVLRRGASTTPAARACGEAAFR
jgi:hypothetical protein